MLVLQTIAREKQDNIKRGDSIQEIYFIVYRAICPIVIDTCSSLSIMPNQEVFPLASSTVTQLNGLASQNPVMGIGQVKWVFRGSLGKKFRVF